MITNDKKKLASELKGLLEIVSEYFEKHTSKICPRCKTVCCMVKHGYYDEEDRIFLSALGVAAPSFNLDRQATDLCTFLKENGCSLPRWRRPFHCTWFFCEPLHGSMLDGSRNSYKMFISSYKKLILIRQQLLQLLDSQDSSRRKAPLHKKA